LLLWLFRLLLCVLLLPQLNHHVQLGVQIQIRRQQSHLIHRLVVASLIVSPD
jgi:hypothetical protein